MAKRTIRAGSARSNVVPLYRHKGPPPFDPNNPEHLQRWENLYALGVAILRDRARQSCPIDPTPPRQTPQLRIVGGWEAVEPVRNDHDL